MGRTNNPNGRPKGTPNKVTAEMREILKGILAEELGGLAERLRTMPDEKRVDVLLRLMPYVFPRVNLISHLAGEPFEYDPLTAMFME